MFLLDEQLDLLLFFVIVVNDGFSAPLFRQETTDGEREQRDARDAGDERAHVVHVVVVHVKSLHGQRRPGFGDDGRQVEQTETERVDGGLVLSVGGALAYEHNGRHQQERVAYGRDDAFKRGALQKPWYGVARHHGADEGGEAVEHDSHGKTRAVRRFAGVVPQEREETEDGGGGVDETDFFGGGFVGQKVEEHARVPLGDARDDDGREQNVPYLPHGFENDTADGKRFARARRRGCGRRLWFVGDVERHETAEEREKTAQEHQPVEPHVLEDGASEPASNGDAGGSCAPTITLRASRALTALLLDEKHHGPVDRDVHKAYAETA